MPPMAESNQSDTPRPGGRAFDDLRPVTIETGVQKYAEGSALISFGDTRVLVAASGLDAAPVGLAGLVVAAGPAERRAEAAPGVPLVLREGEVLAQLLRHLLPLPQLLELEGEAEPETRVVGVLLQHPLKAFDTGCAHTRKVPRRERAAQGDRSAGRAGAASSERSITAACIPLCPGGEDRRRGRGGP